ncbi:MAG: alpha/beta hydrolase [Thermoguttaceae bacterium]|jgi:acetyl esterase/lipase
MKLNYFISSNQFLVTTICFFGTLSSVVAQSPEKVEFWPDLAPGVTVLEPNVEDPNVPNAPAVKVTTPFLLIQRPENKASDSCVLIIPGGGFNVCFYKNEGFPPAKYWNERGYTTAILVYRVPRPASGPIYAPALQDTQRAIRYLRANAQKYGFNPDKIGVEGYSAGACLALLAAANSETQTYEPIDDLDKIPCNVAFAIPLYPAYVLNDGATGPNSNRGDGASLLSDFHFDGHTPPMCLIHGDADIYSSLGSIEVYKKLRKMDIPCELHIFADAPHGYMFWDDLPNARSWQDRRFAWAKKMGF